MIPAAIEKAAEAVGAQPTTSQEALSEDVDGNAQLQEYFNAEVSNSIEERLEGDTDFIPMKYPNTVKYLKKKEM